MLEVDVVGLGSWTRGRETIKNPLNAPCDTSALLKECWELAEVARFVDMEVIVSDAAIITLVQRRGNCRKECYMLSSHRRTRRVPASYQYEA